MIFDVPDTGSNVMAIDFPARTELIRLWIVSLDVWAEIPKVKDSKTTAMAMATGSFIWIWDLGFGIWDLGKTGMAGSHGLNYPTRGYARARKILHVEREPI
jgi:hypothetical protein